MFYCLPSLILLIIIHVILDLQLLGSCSTNQEQTAPGFAQQQVDDVNIIAVARPALLQLISSACLPNNDSIAAIYLPHEGSITNRQLRRSQKCCAILNLQFSVAILNPQCVELQHCKPCNWLPSRNIRAYPSPWEPSAWEEPQFINRVHVNHHLEDASLNIPTRRPGLIRQMH